MTTCKCTQKDHDHTIECSHTGISGDDHDNTICNWCDVIKGNPSQSTINIHKDFTDMLKKEGIRT